MMRGIILTVAGCLFLFLAVRGVRRGGADGFGGKEFPWVAVASSGVTGVILVTLGVIRLASG